MLLITASAVNAWYMGGVDVIDFSNPRNPQEIAFWDHPPAGPTGSDNWSAYWYEGPALPGNTLTVYGTDGVHNPPTGRGFQVFRADIAADEDPLPYLNPQTEEFTLGTPVGKVKRQKARRFATPRKARSARRAVSSRAARAAARRLAP